MKEDALLSMVWFMLKARVESLFIYIFFAGDAPG